jgi:hypothetical protein
VTFLIFYSRIKENGQKEDWADCCARVCDGVYEIQKWHCIGNERPFNDKKAKDNAFKMFEMMYTFKFLPPGRGLWAMGSKAMWSHGGGVLNNCGFFSTEDMSTKPFKYLMHFSMLGVGCGFDTRGEGSRIVQRPSKEELHYDIDDTREGWVESTDLIISTFLYGGPTPVFNYSKIRKRGALLKTFGGTASGPDPLVELHRKLWEVWSEYVGKPLDSTLLVDTGNLIGKCVSMGNIRRSAEIALGRYGDEEFYKLKDDYEKVMAYRYLSNNTVLCPIGADYSKMGLHTAWLCLVGKYAVVRTYEWIDRSFRLER